MYASWTILFLHCVHTECKTKVITYKSWKVFKASCLSIKIIITEHLLLTSEQVCTDYECSVVFPVLVKEMKDNTSFQPYFWTTIGYSNWKMEIKKKKETKNIHSLILIIWFFQNNLDKFAYFKILVHVMNDRGTKRPTSSSL